MGECRNMSTNTQKPKGYDKEHHLMVLHGIVNDIKKEQPDEDVYVDDDKAEIVWGKKSSGQESSFDKYKKDYPWV